MLCLRVRDRARGGGGGKLALSCTFVYQNVLVTFMVESDKEDIAVPENCTGLINPFPEAIFCACHFKPAALS